MPAETCVPRAIPNRYGCMTSPFPHWAGLPPYGVYDIAANAGCINLGITHDTAALAVASIRRWWQKLGEIRYPLAKQRLITADCGGRNGVRVRLWKTELQRLADQTGLTITVPHLPPGTSKWNRIEHRLFALTQNWRRTLLLTHEVIVRLISATRTRQGLTAQCRIDRTACERHPSFRRGDGQADHQAR